MGLFSRKPKIDEKILEITEANKKKIVYQTSLACGGCIKVYQTLESIPGFIEYVKKIAPKLVSPCIRGDVDGAIGLVVSDPILGPLITDVIRSVKERFETMKGLK